MYFIVFNCMHCFLVGDKIPADMRLFKIMSTTLRIDQAILTGIQVWHLNYFELLSNFVVLFLKCFTNICCLKAFVFVLISTL